MSNRHRNHGDKHPLMSRDEFVAAFRVEKRADPTDTDHALHERDQAHKKAVNVFIDRTGHEPSPYESYLLECMLNFGVV